MKSLSDLPNWFPVNLLVGYDLVCKYGKVDDYRRRIRIEAVNNMYVFGVSLYAEGKTKNVRVKRSRLKPSSGYEISEDFRAFAQGLIDRQLGRPAHPPCLNVPQFKHIIDAYMRGYQGTQPGTPGTGELFV